MSDSNHDAPSSPPTILHDPVNRVALAVFLMGAALMLVGNQFKVPLLLGGGFAAIGLGAGISGLQSVLTRRATFVPYQWFGGKTTTYSGISAVLWGFLFIGMGALFGLAGLSIALVPGGWDAVAGRLLSGPTGWGGLLVILGGVVAVLGVIRILSGSAFADPNYGTRLMDLGDRLAGVVQVLIGLGLALAGGVAILAPSAGAALIKSFFARLLTGGG